MTTEEVTKKIKKEKKTKKKKDKQSNTKNHKHDGGDDACNTTSNEEVNPKEIDEVTKKEKKKMKKDKKKESKTKKSVTDNNGDAAAVDENKDDGNNSDNQFTAGDDTIHEPDENEHDDDCKDNTYEEEGEENDDYTKIFLSRIPSHFNEESITRIFHENFGNNCILNVALCEKYGDDEEEADQGRSKQSRQDEQTRQQSKKDNSTSTKNNEDKTNHRGFAFITMSSIEKRNEAIDKGTIRGGAKESSKRKHTMYIRPIVRDEDDVKGPKTDIMNICFLWSKFRCPYGDECKFKHIGEGGCLEQSTNDHEATNSNKKQKCFSFRTKGKCKLGDQCPYSHDIPVKNNDMKNNNEDDHDKKSRDPQDKDCINWKTKGKCRKGDKCPYRHDEKVREAFVSKKEKKKSSDRNNDDRKRGRSDNPQPLSIRVFGLNYETKEEDIRKFFEHCGTIREITFPKYEDSGRSKGYCGVLFTSPKATEKATEMDGSSLHGRWLSIQGGKMYLKQWEEREEERTKKTKKEEVKIGEFGQKVKRRKKHGFEEEKNN